LRFTAKRFVSDQLGATRRHRFQNSDPAIQNKPRSGRHAGVKDAAVSWRATRQKADILKLVGSESP
jgi:hypothetical protein